jgi:hypothetical protein
VADIERSEPTANARAASNGALTLISDGGGECFSECIIWPISEFLDSNVFCKLFGVSDADSANARRYPMYVPMPSGSEEKRKRRPGVSHGTDCSGGSGCIIGEREKQGRGKERRGGITHFTIKGKCQLCEMILPISNYRS